MARLLLMNADSSQRFLFISFCSFFFFFATASASPGLITGNGLRKTKTIKYTPRMNSAHFYD